ncbi:MAG: hypothetical protein NVSMB57_06750 [Actinomycetota bacterium]
MHLFARPSARRRDNSARLQRPYVALLSIALALSVSALPASSHPDPARFPGARTVPDPACRNEYWFDPVPFANIFAGILTGKSLDVPAPIRDAINSTGPDRHGPMTGNAPSASIAATLPNIVHFRGRTETYNDQRYYAVRGGTIFTKPNVEATGMHGDWRELLVPSCLDGKVTEISADGTLLNALNPTRDIYTLDMASGSGAGAWTRRWGPFFWTDMGARVPADVRDWDTSLLNAESDSYFVDSAGRKQKPAGIVTIYGLRGDGRRITYLDPWLPSDASREVCGPKRGTVAMAGLAGSGSTIMVITSTGEVYTRLYEFDVSGANTVLLNYSWRDQETSANPRIQLPSPEWVSHGRIPGTATDRISIRKLSPGTEHRIMRVEGVNANGDTGYWEKDSAGGSWRFVTTGDTLTGKKLPLKGAQAFSPEDASYEGTIDGLPAHVTNFNPYCSPTTLRIDFPSGPLDLVLHSVDGLRQERRARGLDLSPRYYRSALEVPRTLWTARSTLDADKRAFLTRYFKNDRFIEGPLYATAASVHVWETCWLFNRMPGDPTALVTQPHVVDAGTSFADVTAQGMEERGPVPARCSAG